MSFTFCNCTFMDEPDDGSLSWNAKQNMALMTDFNICSFHKGQIWRNVLKALRNVRKNIQSFRSLYNLTCDLQQEMPF